MMIVTRIQAVLIPVLRMNYPYRMMRLQGLNGYHNLWTIPFPCYHFHVLFSSNKPRTKHKPGLNQNQHQFLWKLHAFHHQFHQNREAKGLNQPAKHGRSGQSLVLSRQLLRQQRLRHQALLRDFQFLRHQLKNPIWVTPLNRRQRNNGENRSFNPTGTLSNEDVVIAKFKRLRNGEPVHSVPKPYVMLAGFVTSPVGSIPSTDLLVAPLFPVTCTPIVIGKFWKWGKRKS